MEAVLMNLLATQTYAQRYVKSVKLPGVAEMLGVAAHRPTGVASVVHGVITELIAQGVSAGPPPLAHLLQ